MLSAKEKGETECETTFYYVMKQPDICIKLDPFFATWNDNDVSLEPMRGLEGDDDYSPNPTKGEAIVHFECSANLSSLFSFFYIRLLV